MKLNIEKLKSKLNNISNSVHCKVDKFYSDTFREYYNFIKFNDLIQTYLGDNKNLKDDIDRLRYTTDCVGVKNFDIM